MLYKSNIFLKKLLILFTFFLIVSSTINSSLAAGTENIPAIDGKAVIGNTVFYPFIGGFGEWKKISTTGEIFGPIVSPPQNKKTAYTFGENDGIKITYHTDGTVPAINLNGKNPGEIIYLDNIEVGSVVGAAESGNMLDFRTYLSENEFNALSLKDDFKDHLKSIKEKLGQLKHGNTVLKGLSDIEIFKKLYVLGQSSNEANLSGEDSKSSFHHYITLTGKGANKHQHGFNADQNDYSSLGSIDLRGCHFLHTKGVVIEADNGKLIHLRGTQDKPNFILDQQNSSTAMLIKTPLQVNEWSLSGFNKIVLNARLELIEKANINFTPPLDRMHFDYKNDHAGLVFGVNATGGKNVTLNAALKKPTQDDQYLIAFRSTAPGGMLTVHQNGHDIGVNKEKRYKELLLEGPGGIRFNGPGEIFAKNIAIKDNGGDIILDKKIDSGDNSLLRFDGDRKLRILHDLSISTIDLNGNDVMLSLENGSTIKGDIKSTGTGQLFVMPGSDSGTLGNSKISGNIDNIKDIIISRPFILDGNAMVKKSILLDNSNSDLMVEDGKKVTADEIKSSAVGTKLTFLGSGKVVSPTIGEVEIHSNGPKHSVVELKGDIASNLLKYLHASTVKVTGHFNPEKIDFNSKEAKLVLRGGEPNEPYKFNPVLVEGASKSTLNIFGVRKTKSIAEILNINEINLGGKDSEDNEDKKGELRMDVVDGDVTFPKTIVELKHKDSVLRVENTSHTNDRTVTLASPLAKLRVEDTGVIKLVSLSKKLTLQALPDSNPHITDKVLEKLYIKGNVTIAGGQQKVKVNHVQQIHIGKNSVFSDFGNTSLLANNTPSLSNELLERNIFVGNNNGSKEVAARYIVGIDSDNTIHKKTKINFRNSWSAIELRNTAAASTKPRITFNGSIEHAQNAEMILRGEHGMCLERSAAMPSAFTDLRRIEAHGIVMIPPVDGFDVSKAKMLDIIDGEFKDHSGTSSDIPEINIGNSTAFATYELDATKKDCCINSNIKFHHEGSVFIIHNDSATTDRVVTMTENVIPTNNGHSIVIKKSVHAGKKLTIGATGHTFGNSDLKFKRIRFCGDGKLDIKSTVYAANIQLAVPEIVADNVNADRIDFLTATKYLANGNITGDVYFNGNNGELILADGKNINGSVYNGGSNNGNGTVKFAGINGSSFSRVKGSTYKLADSFTNDLGTQNSRLLLIDFANDATVGDAYADSINIAAGKTATFAGTNSRNIQISSINVNGASLPRTKTNFSYNSGVGSNSLTIDPTGKARFNNAVLIDAPISQGQLEFMSDAWVKQKVSGVSSATLAQGKNLLLEKGFEAGTIVADGARIMVMSPDVAFKGQMDAQNFGVDLGNYSVQFAGNKKFTGIFEINTIYNSTTQQGGNIVVESGENNKINFAEADQVKVKLAANSDIDNIPPGGLKYKVILSTNALTPLDINKVILDVTGEQNRFVSWSVESFDNNNLILQVANNFTPIVPTVPGSTAYQFYNDLGRMTESQAAEAVNKLSSREAKGIDADISPIITAIMNQVSAYIDQRAIGSNQVNNAIGAGDCDKQLYGLWVTPFYSSATQKMLKGVSGYKAKSSGAVVGFDTLINDQLMVGLAYSRIETKLSHRDIKQGDKTKGKTDIYALYGLYNLPNSSWFSEGIASYGTTRTKNSEARITSTAMETAYAKYRSNTYSGQLLVGYDYQATQQLMLTPLFGGRYSKFEDLGYTEYGTRFENLIVKRRKYSKIEGIAGIRGQTVYVMDKALLIPEIHGYVNYDFKGSSPKIDARIDGMLEPLPTKSWKPSRTFYIVGAGLTAKLNNSEYGGTYNCNIADKYLGHQLSLKFRLNF